MTIYHALRERLHPATIGQAAAAAIIPLGLPPLLLYGTDLAVLQGVPVLLRIIGFVLLWLAVSYGLMLTVLKTIRIKTVAEAAQENAEHLKKLEAMRASARAASASAYLGIPAAEKIPQADGSARAAPAQR